MLELASQITIYLILAGLMGGIIGYLLGKSTSNNDSCHKAPLATHELHIDNLLQRSKPVEVTALLSTPSTTKRGVKPLLLTKAREGGKDNLQRIKGVGKVLEKLLNETGIYHFDQLANLTNDEIQWIDNSLSFPGRIQREKWIEQAKALAVETKSI